tara:strand:+ start:1383 stop:2618 length:1236 start_codon:yes stop_codon:yes gene_type:complete
MKKNVIILGEEYWFEIKTKSINFVKAKYLLEQLENNDKYTYYILKNPGELLEKIDELGRDNIYAIFLFQDILSDSFLNKIPIYQMKKLIKNLVKKDNINVYPGISVTDMFGGKKYYDILVKKMQYSALPHSRVVILKNFNAETDNTSLTKLLYKESKEMLKRFKKIIIKKGYSYEGKQVQFINREIINDRKKFQEKVDKLDKKKYFGVKADASMWENKIDRYYILQGNNEVIKEASNEYRVYFFNGKAKYIAWADNVPNQCTADVEKKTFEDFDYHKKDIVNDRGYRILNTKMENIDILNSYNPSLGTEILRFAKKVYQDFLPYYWNNKPTEHPIMFRIDISYAEDKLFMDEHSINVEGFDTPIRLYINEMEIDPTNYFYNNILCKKNKEINAKSIQIHMGTLINKYLRKM